MNQAAHETTHINWQAPWLWCWRDLGQQLAQRIAHGEPVHTALNAQGNGHGPVRFVPQHTMPEGAAYEAFIFETGCVPTRDNLHDFFNGLAWLVFPHTKSRLNALQYGEIRSHGIQATRGALRDALTLFDENAALVTLPAPIIHALDQRDWHTALVTHRTQWIHQPPVLFGHALLEKLVSPYKSITSHVFCAPGSTRALTSLDSQLAAQLQASALVPKPFFPLPVLGVPLWCDENKDPDFYLDRAVFRPARHSA